MAACSRPLPWSIRPENHFDERIAGTYEAKWPELFDPAAIDPVVSFLADLAGAGAALELGIGTGRIAIPLSQRGVPVHGIDLSPHMVYQLQAKPSSDEIGGRVETYSKPHRYLWPSKLDLMARLAGMSLRER